MILLDTDHTTFLKYPDSERGRRLIDRLDAASASEFMGVAIVTFEERMRGWLAVIGVTPWREQAEQDRHFSQAEGTSPVFRPTSSSTRADRGWFGASRLTAHFGSGVASISTSMPISPKSVLTALSIASPRTPV